MYTNTHARYKIKHFLCGVERNKKMVASSKDKS